MAYHSFSTTDKDYDPHIHTAIIKKTQIAIVYILLLVLGIFMLYPILWLVSSTLKPNVDIFTTTSLIPKDPTLSAYISGWKTSGPQTYATYFMNTFMLVGPTVLFTLLSSLVVAYGFARFRFRFKKILFALMLSSLMLPNEVLLIPRYIFFNKLGWINSYLPIIIPSIFATYSFFIFLMVQFIRTLPKELDEAAIMDGCNSFRRLINIILPLCKPAIISVTIFQFVWRWNDYLNVLVYINSTSKFPLSLALRMNLDTTDTIMWGNTLAMVTLAIVPPTIVFFLCQRYFVEGIATTGIKG